MMRLDKAGGTLLEAERKKQSPKLHQHPGAAAYAPERLASRALVLSQADALPKMYSIKEALATTAAFAGNVPGLLQKVRGLIKSRKIAARHDTVVVMATNLGTLDLVANFVCSVASVPELEPTLASVLVFASDGGTRDAVEKLGIAAFSDPALGPAERRGQGRGRRLVRDPLPYFAEIADDQVDTFWMDDGARSSRYTPWYANSGFYFLRANERVVFFMHRLLMSYDVILAVRSHQHALIMLLTDLMAKHGLTAQLLPNTDFPQGQVFHHKKEIMKDFVAGRRKPYVFHMCWTASRVDKLRYLKNIALWFLDPSCPDDSWANASRLDGHHDRSCCLAGAKAWTADWIQTDEAKQLADRQHALGSPDRRQSDATDTTAFDETYAIDRFGNRAARKDSTYWRRAATLRRACEVVDKYGDVDFVDLNMGCPIDLVCSKGGGAALMRRNKKVRSILEMGLERLSVPMTLKMRTGWDEDPKLAHTMAGYAQAWAHELGPGSVACVFVHGRSRTARYSRAANWAYVETVARCQDDAIPKLPIIGNGDIMSYADWEEKRKTAPPTRRPR
ncbi:tRNA dihydrouridine synthase [Aureococcus anophagefferens]|nr:tRNA dihydrouridine synthase [Aureococcus anophagefferens]